VAGPVDEAGRALVDIALTSAEVAPAITLPTHLRVRASTAAAPPIGETVRTP
jgi:hypothetical protein